MSQAETAGPTAAAVRPLALLGSELATLFRRWRTITMLSALAAVPVLIGIAVRVAGAGSGRGPAFIGAITDNGLFVAFTAIAVSIPVFLPMTLAVVAGDTIAGEASLGTLRYLLVAPSGRLRILLVKYAACAAFAIAATLTVALFGCLIGAILFHIGPVTLLSGSQVGFWGFSGRILLLALYETVSLLGLAAIGLFASTLTSVPVGAMAATIVLAAVAQVVDALPQLDWIHPWLFSHYWLGIADVLRSPVEWGSFLSNLWLQLGYLAVFGALAYGRFTTKDIAS
ncbi:ABC transporter permease subunit [Gryllotalpicola sp.]|uniref:ABC transporter permease n=1 Tax=Gryllotalpicola sp. TaxID=1932787 RepID=UPI002634F7F9|nr:ABC transporter permease subunit [Gryllotalpicola sp.]